MFSNPKVKFFRCLCCGSSALKRNVWVCLSLERFGIWLGGLLELLQCNSSLVPLVDGCAGNYWNDMILSKGYYLMRVMGSARREENFYAESAWVTQGQSFVLKHSHDHVGHVVKLWSMVQNVLSCWPYNAIRAQSNLAKA